jgi:hypothetical protein
MKLLSEEVLELISGSCWFYVFGSNTQETSGPNAGKYVSATWDGFNQGQTVSGSVIPSLFHNNCTSGAGIPYGFDDYSWFQSVTAINVMATTCVPTGCINQIFHYGGVDFGGLT